MKARALFVRLLGHMRRASQAVRRAVTWALLVAVYVLVLPWFALLFRVFGRPRPRGWQRRDDGEVGTLARLRRPF